MLLTLCTALVSDSTIKPHAKFEYHIFELDFSSDNNSIVINEKRKKRKRRLRVNDRIIRHKNMEKS